MKTTWTYCIFDTFTTSSEQYLHLILHDLSLQFKTTHNNHELFNFLKKIDRYQENINMCNVDYYVNHQEFTTRQTVVRFHQGQTKENFKS